MPIIKNSIMLLKSQKSDGISDKFETLLKSNGFDVRQVKTLDFRFENLDILAAKLRATSDYSGIIFSSPRCVSAVQQALNGEQIPSDWLDKANFAVGETTARDALDKVGLKCEGKEAGNANNLSRIIINGTSYDGEVKPFLFPHGNLKTDTLNNELAKARLTMDNVLVYETVVNPQIEREFSSATRQLTELPEFVVFFSPSGLTSTIDLIRAVTGVDLSLVKFVAIGPVTELAMREHALNVVGVAKNPNPEDVLNVIRSAM